MTDLCTARESALAVADALRRGAQATSAPLCRLSRATHWQEDCLLRPFRWSTTFSVWSALTGCKLCCRLRSAYPPTSGSREGGGILVEQGV